MSKALRTVAMVAGAVALVATGVGAAAGAGLLGSAATGATGVVAGIGVGTISTVATVASLVAGAAGLAAGLTVKKPSARGSATDVTIMVDPPQPYLMGRSYSAGVLRHDVGYGGSVNGVKNPYLAKVVVYSGAGPIQEIESRQFDYQPISFTGGWYFGFIGAEGQLGLTPEPTALPAAFAGVPNWSAAHKLSGQAAVLWNFKFDKKAERYASGIPPYGIVAKGVRVYDPRLDSTYTGGSGPQRIDDETTWAYSENPALHAIAYLYGRYQTGYDSVRRKVFGIGIPASGIDMPRFVAWANVCDANNWKIGGTIYEPADRWVNLKDIMAAGGGEPVFAGGMMSVYYNAPQPVIDTVTENDLAADDQVLTAMQSYRDRKNGIIPKFRSETNNWQYVSVGVVKVDAYIEADGEERFSETQFNLVQQSVQASQLAGYEMLNSREMGPIAITLKPQWRRYKAGDRIRLRLPSLDLDHVVTIKQREIDPASLTVKFICVTETAGKDDFALGRTSVPPVPPVLASGQERDQAASNNDNMVQIGDIRDEDGNPLTPEDIITKEGTAKHVEMIGDFTEAQFVGKVAQAEADIDDLQTTYGTTASAAASAAAAQASALAAANSQESAGTSAGLAAAKATEAGGHATAASGSATTAETKATEAGLAAASAQASVLEASVAVRNAMYLDAAYSWDFMTGLSNGWSYWNGTFTPAVGGASFADVTVDAQLLTPVISIDGSRFNRIILEVTRLTERPAGSYWEGKVFWSNATHGWSGDYSAQMDIDPPVGVKTTITLDIPTRHSQNLPANGALTDWITHPINQLRFDFDHPSGGQFKIHSARIVGPDTAAPSNNATVASNAAAIATEQAALASSSSTLAARVASGLLNMNPLFTDYPNDAVGAYPVNWGHWVGSAHQRVANPRGGWAIRIPSPAGDNAGIAQGASTKVFSTGGYYVMEAEVLLEAGDLNSAGILLFIRNSSDTDVQQLEIPFRLTLDESGKAGGAGQVGRVYNFSKMFKVVGPDARGYGLYAMSSWSGHGDIGTANTLVWRKIGFRPATAEEIKNGGIVRPKTLNENSDFSSYPSAAMGTYPTGWVWWDGAAGFYRILNPDGTTSIYMNGPAGGGGGLRYNEPSKKLSTGDYIVIDADVTLNSGSFAGAGVLFSALNSAATAEIEGHVMSFQHIPSSVGPASLGTAGQRYRFQKVFRFVQPDVSGFNMYAMAHWAGHGDVSNANSLIWHSLEVRHATQAEIAGEKVPSLEATVWVQGNAIANHDLRLASYLTRVSAGPASAEVALVALDSNGQSASSIGIRADRVTLGSQTTPALDIAGGNARFNGILNVGPDSGARMKITANTMEVFNASNVRRGRWGIF